MKKALTIVALLFCVTCLGQNDFSGQIQKVADTLAKKIIQSGNKKIAVVEFINLDESVSRLGQFLSDELSSELSNLTDNLSKFEVVERSNIDLIFKEKRLIQSTDGSKMAKDLGKLNVADILVWAIISDFEGYYRVNLKLLDTKSGSALSAFKTQFIKTPTLENFNKQIVKKSGETTSSELAMQENKSKPASIPSIPNDPCRGKTTGIIKITNKTEKDVWEITKIAVKVPKYVGANPREPGNFYIVILEKDEIKEVANLQEGFYEYDAKKYNAGVGWCGGCASISGGQVEVKKCETTELIIR